MRAAIYNHNNRVMILEREGGREGGRERALEPGFNSTQIFDRLLPHTTLIHGTQNSLQAASMHALG